MGNYIILLWTVEPLNWAIWKNYQNTRWRSKQFSAHEANRRTSAMFHRRRLFLIHLVCYWTYFPFFCFIFVRRSFKERRKFEYGKCYDYFRLRRSKAKMTKKSSYIEAHITCTRCVQIFIQYLKLAKKTNLKRKLIKSTFWHRCLIWNARNANTCNRQCSNGILKRSRLSIAPRVLNERTSERTNERMNKRMNERFSINI